MVSTFSHPLYLAARSIPFVSGLLILPAARHGGALIAAYLENYLLVILAFGFWKATRSLALHQRRITSRGLRSIFGVLLFAAVALLLMLYLQYLRMRLAEDLFYLMVGAMGAIGAAELATRRKLAFPAALVDLIATSGTAYLFLSLDGLAWRPDRAIFALSLGLAAAAPYIATILTAENSPRYSGLAALHAEAAKQGKWSARAAQLARNIGRARLTLLYSLALLLAPTLIVGLSVFGRLPRSYVLVYLTLPWIARLTQRAQSLRADGSPGADFLRQTSGVCLSFVVIIFAVTLATN